MYLLILLGLLRFASPGFSPGNRMHLLAERGGIWGAGILGIIFALSLCPVSAALFFGSLIPLATTQNSRFCYPALYGVGTAIPVLFFAAVIAFSAKSIGAVFNKITEVDKWARRITSGIFLLAGIYYLIVYTL